MSPTDAFLLANIDYAGGLATIKLMHHGNTYQLIHNARDIVLIDELITTFKPEYSISISNLDRLGLIQISDVSSISDETVYKPYYNLKEYKEAEMIVKNNPEKYKEVSLYKNMYTITPFGSQLRNICLKDS